MSTPAIRPPRVYYGWWIVTTSVIAATAYAFSALSHAVFYRELIMTLHWSRASVAAGGSIRLFLMAVMAPVIGGLIDRFGAKTVLTCGSVGTGLCLLLLSSMHSIWQYYLYCLLLGIALSGIHHMPNHLLVAKWFVKNRGLAISLVTTAVGLGGAVIPLLATYLLSVFARADRPEAGWRGSYVALASVLLIPSVMFLRIVREKPEDMGLHPDGSAIAPGPLSNAAAQTADTVVLGTRELLKSPVFWLLSLAMMLVAASMFGVRDHLMLYMRDLKFSPAISATALSLTLGSSTLGRFFSGTLSDRFSARIVTVLVFFVGGLSLLMLLFVSGFVLAYLFPLLFGLSYGAIINLKPLIIFEYFGTKKVGKVYGLVLGFYVVGSAIGPLLTGYIFDKTQSYQLPFFVNMILAWLSVIAILLLAYQPQPARNRKYAGEQTECSRV